MTIMDQPSNRVPTTTASGDAELAAQYKHEMTLALQAVTLIMDRARAQGLIVTFSNINMSQSGKFEAGPVMVARYY